MLNNIYTTWVKVMNKVDIEKIRNDIKMLKGSELATIQRINMEYGITAYFINKHIKELKQYKPYSCYAKHDYLLKKVLIKYLDTYCR
jgi:hypothetical protein